MIYSNVQQGALTPFITFYTPTYRRPQSLARCMESVQEQTAAVSIEQIVIPDHSGSGGEDGVGRMFGRIRDYADAVHGRYVHILCDDDVLATQFVVEDVQAFAESEGYPDLIVVDVIKGAAQLPTPPAWPPRYCNIDLGCGIIRADVWRRHVADYQSSYDGDIKFFTALHEAGVVAAILPTIFLIGGVSHGAAEAAA